MLAKRCPMAMVTVLVVSFGLAGWLFYLQGIRGAQAKQKAESIWLRRINLSPARGNIYSRNLQLLATCQLTYSVWADPYTLKKVAQKVWGRQVSNEEIASRIAHLLCSLLKSERVSEKDLRKRLSQTVRNRENSKPILIRFVWLARQLDETTVRELKQLLEAKRKEDLKPEWKIIRAGIGISPEMRRIYPYGRVAASVLGFVNIDNTGCYGVERDWDKVLRGKEGSMEIEVDALGRPLPSGHLAYLPPQQGESIILTIDEQIQKAAETVIDEAVKKFQPKSASAIVLDPQTGDILALVSKPDFDPNEYRQFPTERFLSRPLSFVYEPGSTFKPIVAAALLDSGFISERTTARCDGIWKTSNFSVRCWVVQKGVAAHGVETIADALKHSCNIAMAQFALRAPYQQIYEKLSKFGIGRRMDVKAGFEESGWLDPPQQFLSKVALRHYQATLAFGQGVAVTPMQLAVAYAALANYGKVMKPRIVKGIKDERSGQISWLQPKELGNAVSPLTASKIRDMLIEVVEEGTGKRAKLERVKVAGKTGTATKVVNGRYDPTKVVVSFFGFFPADSPKWVIGIVLDEPTYGRWGGEVAAPLFAALGQQILWRVQPPRPLSLTQDLTALSFSATSLTDSQRQ
ncbi:MAG: penicillin-binding protein 2 [Armatimonadetes bacterium]|nr:penicillin-binding protein 2 [Armatimonadota bacterium]MCX7967477.1 penicillin-binding protein 2 [Armatimonadota bacterium]MDW8143503.1 penicillin-binding protein 2 [Armatimonadota bacterium]